MKKISIIIVTYNRTKELKRAIDSCMPLNSNEIEMIVWDNNSALENRIVNEKICNDQEFPIQYYYSEYNLGAGGGKNSAWKKSNAKYVFIMDDDAIIKSDNFFGKIYSYMEGNLNVGAAYVNIFEPSTEHTYRCDIRKNDNSYIKTLAFVGGGHIIRKDTFPQIDLYPPGFSFGSEELYASLLVWDAGFEIHEINNLQVLHLPTAQNRFLGKEREMRILVTSFMIKKNLYPSILVPLSYIMFVFRVIKNKFNLDECRKIMKLENSINKQKKISYKTLIKLMRLFGVKHLL